MLARLPLPFLLLAPVFMWGANFNLAAVAFETVPALPASSERFLLSAALMIALVALRGEWRGFVLALKSPMVLMAGFFGIGCFNLLFFYSVSLSSAVNAALIMGAAPLMTVILAFLFAGERPGRRTWIAIPVAMAGVAAVILGGAATGPVEAAWGDLLMLLADLSYAIYALTVRRAFPVGGPVPDVAATCVVGAIITTIATLLAGGFPDHAPSLRSALSIAAMAVGGTVLTFLLWNEAMKRIGAARSSLFMSLMPVATVLIATAFGDPPTLAQLLGGALVIGAVAWSSWPAKAARRANVADGVSP